MPKYSYSFPGIRVASLLVRGGICTRIPKHTLLNVYGEMLLQITRDYSALGDFRKLTLTEIRFFYDGLRPELRDATKPRKG